MLQAIRNLFIREVVLLWKDSRLRSVVFIAPVVYAALFCFVYSKHSLEELPIALVSFDNSQISRQLVRMLEASPKLTIKIQTDSPEELKHLIYDQSIVGAVVIPRDFTERLKQGHDTVITAYVNASSMVSANTAAKAINEVVQTFSAGVEIKTMMKQGARLSTAKEKFMPVKLDLRSLFNPSFNYSNFMVPGLLIAILQQVILLGIALSWTREIENKEVGSLLSITTNTWALLLGKALPYLAWNMLVSEFYLRVLFPLNDIPMEGLWSIAIPFTFLFVATIVFWGVWVSLLCKNRLFATQILMFVAMPSFILSGFTWPSEGMPAVLQGVSWFLPMTHFVKSFRSIYLAGAPLSYVIKDMGVLLGFLVFNIAFSYWLIHKLKTKELVQV